MWQEGSTVAISPDVLFNEVGGEAVLLNQRDGVYYGLDEVGTRIWTLASQSASLGSVHSTLLDEYDVTSDELWQDIVRLISEMAERGLVASGA
jgi:hypothetical protein